MREAVWVWRLLGLYILFAFGFGVVVSNLKRTDTERDMIIYFQTAQKVQNGTPLYVSRPEYGPDAKPFDYLYLPPFAALISPLGSLDWPTFTKVWLLGLCLCWLGFALVLSFLFSDRVHFWGFVGANSAIFLTHGSIRAFALGQIDPLLWLLFGLGLCFVIQKKRLSGLWFGAASLVKIYSLAAILAFPRATWKREWLAIALLWGAALALGAWVCGVDSYRQWFQNVPPVMSQGTFNSDNFSLSMAVLRAARWLGWEYAGGPISGLPKLWLSAATLLGPIWLLWLTRHQKLPLRVAIVGACAPLFAPICWSSYLPLLLCPLAIWWSEKGPNPAPETAP